MPDYLYPQEVTFEQLPKLVLQMLREVAELKKEILSDKECIPFARKPYNFKEAAVFLDLAEPTLYGVVSRKEIAFSKPGKKLYFFEEDLINYLKNKRVGSKAEHLQEAESEFLAPNKKGGRK